ASLRYLFKFFPADGAESNVGSSPQKCRRIFLRVEQSQRRATDHVPATRRFDWINSGLRSADRDRASRNFFARNISPRGRNFKWQTAEKWKTRRESDTMNAVLGSAMKIDNFSRMNASALRDFLEVEREFLFITNRDL